MHRKTRSAAVALLGLLLIPLGANADDKRAAEKERTSASERTEYRSGDIGSETDRARMGAQPRESNEQNRAVSSIVGDMVHAALEGDVEDYIDYFSEEDRERLENQRVDTELSGVTEAFRNRWESRYGEELADGLEDYMLPINVRQQGDRRANASFKSADKSISFPLVQGGMFNTSWRIDVPNDLTKTSLHRSLESKLQQINEMQLPREKSQAYEQIAAMLLEPVSDKS